MDFSSFLSFFDLLLRCYSFHSLVASIFFRFVYSYHLFIIWRSSLILSSFAIFLRLIGHTLLNTFCWQNENFVFNLYQRARTFDRKNAAKRCKCEYMKKKCSMLDRINVYSIMLCIGVDVKATATMKHAKTFCIFATWALEHICQWIFFENNEKKKRNYKIKWRRDEMEKGCAGEIGRYPPFVYC